jgi:hypothetical protein
MTDRLIGSLPGEATDSAGVRAHDVYQSRERL